MWLPWRKHQYAVAPSINFMICMTVLWISHFLVIHISARPFLLYAVSITFFHNPSLSSAREEALNAYEQYKYNTHLWLLCIKIFIAHPMYTKCFLSHLLPVISLDGEICVYLYQLPLSSDIDWPTNNVLVVVRRMRLSMRICQPKGCSAHYHGENFLNLTWLVVKMSWKGRTKRNKKVTSSLLSVFFNSRSFTDHEVIPTNQFFFLQGTHISKQDHK